MPTDRKGPCRLGGESPRGRQGPGRAGRFPDEWTHFRHRRYRHGRLYERKQRPLACIDECVAREDAGLALYDEDPQIEELRKTLLRLPDEHRVPLVMQVLGGFTTAEIATELGLTVNAVLTRLFRARHKLREIYCNPARAADAAPVGLG